MGRMIIGISGATGAIYGVRCLEVLRQCGDIETHLVMSEPAIRTITYETCYKNIEELKKLAHYTYDIKNIGASIASGSFKTEGMIIAPCSAKTLSAIAYSLNDNLLIRAADVSLKERRRLVILFRETPLHMGHLKAMEKATENGAILLPPLPSFYHKPKTIDDIVNHTVGKVLDLFHIEHKLFKRWEEDDRKKVDF